MRCRKRYWFVAVIVVVVVFEFLPTASAQKFNSAAYFPTPDAAESLVSADLNDDKMQDFVYLASNQTVGIMLATGPHSYGTVQRITAVGDMHAVGVADVNGDGRPDIIATGTLPSQAVFLVYLGNGDGTFQSPIGSGS